MEVSAFLHKYADTNIPRKQQAIVKSFAKALEIIPRQLCDNAGFDATNILTQLRVEHRKGNIWAGVDFDNEGVRNNMEAFVWEPALVKVNAIQAAVEASCMILSVDETISKFFPNQFLERYNPMLDALLEPQKKKKKKKELTSILQQETNHPNNPRRLNGASLPVRPSEPSEVEAEGCPGDEREKR